MTVLRAADQQHQQQQQQQQNNSSAATTAVDQQQQIGSSSSTAAAGVNDICYDAKWPLGRTASAAANLVKAFDVHRFLHQRGGR
jgi:hypothetical protein